MVKKGGNKGEKCPVCNQRSGSGTFLCGGCQPNRWVHPNCGGYTKVEVQAARKSGTANELRCNNCKVVRLHQ